MSSGGSGPALPPLDAKLSVDENGNGTLGGTNVRELGGRVVPNAAQVRILLTDGREVVASVPNGYWLAWWPDTARTDSVVAPDAAGAALARSEVVE